MLEPVFSLGAKCAVVIGVTSGLGKAIALGLAGAAADVVAASKSVLNVDAAAAEIEALGRKSLRITADVRSRESLQALHDQVYSRFGRIDILVNSAGISLREPTMECSEQDWAEILDINLTGTFRACQIFGKP